MSGLVDFYFSIYFKKIKPDYGIWFSCFPHLTEIVSNFFLYNDLGSPLTKGFLEFSFQISYCDLRQQFSIIYGVADLSLTTPSPKWNKKYSFCLFKSVKGSVEEVLFLQNNSETSENVIPEIWFLTDICCV